MPLQQLATSSVLTLEQMEGLGRALATRLAPGDTVTLRGEVGAGKTSFARALILAIAPEKPEVTSPTFNLMQSYDVKTGLLWHLDLYRLEEESETHALGIEDLWPHIVLIEWPEVAERLLPEERLDITFGFTEGTEGRTLAFHGNDAWRQRLAGLT